MPLWARIVAYVVGAVLLFIGLFGLIFIRPLHWAIVTGSIAAAGLACDLFYGAFRGEWPISALFWLIP